MRRAWLVPFALLALLPAVRAGGPHVVLFFVDDLGWADVGFAGSTFHETPHIDRLASRGVVFTAAYSSGSVCSPTRAALMTGKHPARVGITDWIPGAGDRGRLLATPADRHELPLEEVTVAEAFAGAGYATFYAGKWHLGGGGFAPDQQGFGVYFDPHGDPAKGSPSSGTGLPGRAHDTDGLTREAVAFLEDNARERPVFLVLSYFDVHTPIVPDLEHVGRFVAKAAALGDPPPPVGERDAVSRARQDNPDYASMVSAVDDSVGAVVAKLAELGVEEDTLVVFTSDNGGLSTLSRAAPTSNLPLRAGKGWLYEGGIRVPLVVAGAGVAAGRHGTSVADPVTTADLYPTLLDLTKQPARPEQHLDGRSFAGLLAASGEGGGTLEGRDLFWHFPHYHGSRWTPGAAVRAGDLKLIEFYEEGRAELYDLAADPGERRDLASARPDLARELRDRLRRWQESVGARLPVPR